MCRRQGSNPGSCRCTTVPRLSDTSDLKRSSHSTQIRLQLHTHRVGSSYRPSLCLCPVSHPSSLTLLSLSLCVSLFICLTFPPTFSFLRSSQPPPSSRTCWVRYVGARALQLMVRGTPVAPPQPLKPPTFPCRVSIRETRRISNIEINKLGSI